MAFIVGYASPEEIEELERRDWEVEAADTYGLVGDDGEPHRLVGIPPEGQKAVVVFISNSLFEIMDGPDWEKG